MKELFVKPSMAFESISLNDVITKSAGIDTPEHLFGESADKQTEIPKGV